VNITAFLHTNNTPTPDQNPESKVKEQEKGDKQYPDSPFKHRRSFNDLNVSNVQKPIKSYDNYFENSLFDQKYPEFKQKSIKELNMS